MLDRVSLGKLVGSLMHENYNGHIIQHEVLEYVPGKFLKLRMWAVDPAVPRRSGRYKIVSGWFTWLAMDMAACKFVGLRGDNCVTTGSHISLTGMYRKPEVIATVEPVTLGYLVHLYSGSLEVAYGHYFMKEFQGIGEDEDA